MPRWWLATCVGGLLVLYNASDVREGLAATISRTVGMRYGLPENIAALICSLGGLLGFVFSCVGGFQVLRWKNKRDDFLWRTRIRKK